MSKPTKRKDGRWQAYVELPPDPTTGKRKRKYVYGNTRKECSQKLSEAEGKAATGYFFEGDKLTVSAYLQHWLDVYCDNLAPSTVSGYRRYIMNHIVPDIGDIKLSKLLPMHIQGFYNRELQRKYKGKTILQEHRILRKAFSDAVKNNLLVANPADKVTPPQEEPYKPATVLTPEQYTSMLRAAENTVHELPIILAGLLGLRRSEVFALKWKDVDFKACKLTIREAAVPSDKEVHIKKPKNASSFRELVIPKKLMPIFKKYRGMPESYVCLNEKGNPQSVKSYNCRFRNFLKNNGLPHCRFHDLRHYNATLMLRLGIDAKQAAERLGHSTPVITQKLYQHVTVDMDQEAAEKINRTI